MEISKYPLDFDQLSKGSTIPQSQIEEVLGMKADDPRYWKAVLTLRDRIRKELSQRGLCVTIKQSAGDLVILTDAEASIYNYTWASRHLSGYMRSHEQLLNVDRKNLSISEKTEHSKRIEVSSKYAQALVTTTRSIHSSNNQTSLPLPTIEPRKRVI
jgi:hypothetical protein